MVEIAGCGVCHTDLGYYYDGVRTKHALPLALGHEISGHVVDGRHRTRLPGSTDRAVIVPAVIPCGDCDACKRGKATICPNQKMPGNDIQGGFATPHRRAGARTVRRSTKASLWRRRPRSRRRVGRRRRGDDALSGGGAGRRAATAISSSSTASAASAAMRADRDRVRRHGRRDRRQRRQARGDRRGQGAALTLNCAQMSPRDLKARDPELRQGTRPAPDRVDHLRMLRHPRRPGDRLQPAQSRRDARRRRLHHGQGRGAAVEPDGVSRARARQLGLPARALSGGARPRAERPRQGRARSSRSIRSATSTRCSRPSTHGELKRRAVLVPAPSGVRNELAEAVRSSPLTIRGAQGSRSRRRARAQERHQGRALREAPGEGRRRQAGRRALQRLDHARQPERSSTPTPPTW